MDMDVALVTPLAGLVGLAVAAAVWVLVAAEGRARGVASALGLVPRGRAAGAPEMIALVLTGGLLALAAAQPVASRVEPRPGRTDAEALFVFDISRSMEARERPEGPTRFARALAAAKELRSAMPSVPAGVASVTDRVLPHLFPTTSANTFTSTLDRSLGIQKPPPDRTGRGRATALGALTALATNNFYGDEAQRRLAIVFTDGETLPVDLGTLRARMLGARIRPLFIRLWSPDDRIYARGVVEQGYRPDPASANDLAAVALAVEGNVFDERELDKAGDRARALLGDGPTGHEGSELRSVELAPHAAAAAFLPLLFLLWRRNVR
jgi:von Willebrand factor type A domain